MEWTGGIHGNIRVLALKEGRSEGRKEGLNEGLVKGRKEGLDNGRKMLARLLHLKFGEVPAPVLERIETASWETINAMVDMALAAKDPTELLAD